MEFGPTMRNIKKSRLVATLLAVVAALVFISSIGTSKHYAFFTPVEFNGPTFAASNGEITAITDSQSRRVLVLDKNLALIKTIDYNVFNSPIQAVTNIDVSDKKIFVAGVVFLEDSNVIQGEKVLMYRLDGTYEGVVYETKEDTTYIHSIKSLSRAPNGVVITYYPTNAATAAADGSGVSAPDITFISINDDGKVVSQKKAPAATSYDVFDAAYNAVNGSYITLSYRGLLLDFDDEMAQTITAEFNQGHVFTDMALADNDDVYATDDVTGSVFKISDLADVQEIIKGVNADMIKVFDDKLILCNQDKNSIIITDLKGNILHNLTQAPLSPAAALDVILFEISVVYLLVFLTFAAVKRIRKSFKESNSTGLAPLFGSVAVVLAVSLAIGYSSYTVYKSSLETRVNEISAFADYTHLTASDISEPLEKCASREAFRDNDAKGDEVNDGLVSIYTHVGFLVDSATDNKIGIYFNVYGKDKDGVFYIYDSSMEHISGTSSSGIKERADIEEAFSSNDLYDLNHEVKTGSLLRDTTLYRLVKVPKADGNGVAGVIEIGSRMRSFESSIANSLTQNVLALIVLSLVVYLAYVELRDCVRCMFEYRQLHARRKRDAIAVLTRPFTFVVTMLTSIDAVMTVLIARDLIASAGMDDSGLLLALPAAMLGIGLAIGQLLYGKLGSRIGVRRLTVVGALVMLLFAVGTALVVGYGSFWLYCLAKLFMSVPFGMLYALGYSLPRVAESDDVRKTAASGVSHTDTSAAALGTVLGGFVAQALGNQWVYVLIALATLPVILMAINMFPKTNEPIEASHRRGKGMTRLFANPRIIALAVLVMLPVIIATGYNSFIFPLFASNAGVSIASTNYLFVIGQLVVYVTINLIGRMHADFGRRRVMTAALALLGVVFLLFSINTTVVWSVVVIALVGVLCKTVDGWKGVWLDVAERSGVQAGEATGAMFATRSVILIVQPFILASLLAANDAFIVIVIGAICVAAALAYHLIIRKLDPEGK